MGSAAGSEPSLLRRDEEALDRVAQVLRRGRPAFAIVACPGELRPLALGYLNGRMGGRMAAAKVPRDANELLEMLTAQARAEPESVLSLDLGEEAERLLATLNLHREKLRSGGCTVVWLASADGLRAVHEVAPDAYSFRDAVAIVQGAAVISGLVPAEEPEEVAEARRQLERARGPLERAVAARNLSYRLRALDRLDEAEVVALHAWEELQGPKYDDDAGRERRAELCFALAAVMAQNDSAARQRRWVSRGLAEAREGFEWRFWLAAASHGAYSSDRVQVESALKEAVHRTFFGDKGLQLALLRARGWNARERDDLRGARAVLDLVPQLDERADFRARIEIDAAKVELLAGRLAEAERRALSSRMAFAEAHESASSIAVLFAESMFLRGEIEAARHAVARALSELSTSAWSPRLELQRLLANVSQSTGDPACLAELRLLLKTAAERGADGAHYGISEDLATAAIQLHEAGLITDADLRAVESDLAVAQDASFSMVGDDPPWYVIRFPGLRSEILAHHPALRSEAIALAEQALTRARRTKKARGAPYEVGAPTDSTELAAEQGRRLLSALFLAGRTADLLEQLPAIEAEARRDEIFVELVKILRLAVAAATIEDRPAEAKRAMEALRETFSRTDSPRMQAETLLDLAISLPSSATAPDSLALAEEAYALFLEMPIPASEARCLEVAGDVLIARAKPEEARRRYTTAHRKLTRYGLNLRVPSLTRKLAALTR